MTAAATAGASERFLASDRPMKDPALEGRLARATVYKTRPGDTLVSVANLVWGHRTWWRRLKQGNPRTKGFGPEQPLPVGLKLLYRAPAVGDEYVVRENDWLIRIVQWKYGNTETWEAIYRKNSRTIENPNLIHPGDRLLLKTDGTVKNVQTGEIVVRGVRSPEPALLVSAQPVPVEAASAPAAFFQPHVFAVGLGVGALAVLALVLSWWSRRPLSGGAQRAPSAGTGRSEHRAPAAEPESVESDGPELGTAGDPRGFPFTFKRRPLDPLEPDFSQLGKAQDGDIDRRPNYHSLRGKKPKRLAKSKKKVS